MSDKKSNNSSWFFSALTLLFIGLKLTKYITWSWLWVLAPVWMPLSAVIAGFVLYLLIDWAYKSKRERIAYRKFEKKVKDLSDSLDDNGFSYHRSNNARNN